MSRVMCLDDALLQMFLERVLDPLERDIVNEHLRTCPSCQRTVAEYKQLMWDLEHPEESPLPASQAVLYESLMTEWRNRDQQTTSALSQQKSRSLLPAWAGYSLLWTRKMPGAGLLGLSRSQQPSEEASRTKLSLRRVLRRKGGGRR